MSTTDELRGGELGKEAGGGAGLSTQELDHDETCQRAAVACTSSSLFLRSGERPQPHISVVSLLIIGKMKGEDRSMNHYCLVWLHCRTVFRNS